MEVLDLLDGDRLSRRTTEVLDGDVCVQLSQTWNSGFCTRLSNIALLQEELYLMSNPDIRVL